MEKFHPAKQQRILLWISGIFTLFLTIALSYVDQPLKNPVAPHGIVSFELAGSIQTARAILDSWNAQARLFAAFSLGIDFLYLTAYPLFIALLIYKLAEKFRKSYYLFYRFGLALALLQPVAGVLDAIENYGLIRLLFGSMNGTFASLAFFAATVKFTLIVTGVLYFAVGSFWIKFAPPANPPGEAES
jgi:hypothetical protein